MEILVCDADYKHALGIVRALGKLGHRVFVLADRKHSMCSSSRYCSREYLCPAYNDPTWEESVIRVIEESRVELVVPVGATSFRKFSALKEKTGKISRIVISDHEKISFCMSKERTYKHAAGIGIPVPRTIYPDDESNIKSLPDDFPFPCVVKGRHETGFNIVDYASDRDDLIQKYELICRKYSLESPGDLPIVQERITGDGYGFFAIYNDGACGLTFQHHRRREYPPTGGASVASESSRNSLVSELGRKLLDSLKWHGVAMVEFKMNSDDVPVLMEINPKFWGSLDLALEAGVNFPGALVDIALGKEVPFSDRYEYPFRYHWPLHGDILHAILRPGKIPAVIADTINPRVHSNLWFRDDFRGTVGIVRSTIGKVIRRFI